MEELNKQEIKSSMPEIFINFLSFVLLGVVATSVSVIFFQVINKYFPDVLSATYSNYQLNSASVSAIQYSIASLIIGFPIYIWAIWFWFRSFATENGAMKVESKLSRWLTYIVLLITGGVIIGDLITIIFNFLQGEYGMRFLSKAVTIFIVSGVIFSFYFLERKRIQYKKDISSGLFWLVGSVTGILVILSIILGFVVGGTPSEARLRKFDSQRAQDLQMVSSAVSNFAFENSRLPKDLSEIKDNVRYNYGASYIDPETKENYEYRIISQGSGVNDSAEYELCGVFSLSTLSEIKGVYEYGYGNWAEHDQGRVCKTQTATFGQRDLPLGKPAPLPIR